MGSVVDLPSSSAFCSHSTKRFVCSRKMLFPFELCAPLCHFRIVSSLTTSATTQTKLQLKFLFFKLKPNHFKISWQSKLFKAACAASTFHGRVRSCLYGFKISWQSSDFGAACTAEIQLDVQLTSSLRLIRSEFAIRESQAKFYRHWYTGQLRFY